MTTPYKLLSAVGSVWLALLVSTVFIPRWLLHNIPLLEGDSPGSVFRWVVWAGIVVLVGGAIAGISVVFSRGLAARVLTVVITVILSAGAWAVTSVAASLLLGKTLAFIIGPLGYAEWAGLMAVFAVESALIVRWVSAWGWVAGIGHGRAT